MKNWQARLFDPFVALDRLVLALVERLVLFGTEWFGVTQSQIEVSILTIYALLSFVASNAKWLRFLDVLLGGGVALILLVLSQFTTPTIRQYRRTDPTWIVLRLIMMFLAMITSWAVIEIVFWVLRAHLHRLTAHDISGDLRSIVLALFYYLSAIDSNGTPGRRRKAVLSKIKSMFGTGWLPQPERT